MKLRLRERLERARARRRGRRRRERERAAAGAGDAGAGAGLDHPRAVRGHPAGAAARVRRGARLPHGRRGGGGRCSSPRPGTSGWPSAWSRATTCCWTALDREHPARGRRPAAASAARCAASRARWSSSATCEPLVAEAPSTPRAWRGELLAQARARRARSLRGGARRATRWPRALARAGGVRGGMRASSTGRRARARLLRARRRSRANFGLQAATGRRRRRSQEARDDRGLDRAGRRRAGRRALGARPARAAGARALRAWSQRYEAKKRERGVLDFLDLLVKARDALRDRESVRALLPPALPLR